MNTSNPIIRFKIGARIIDAPLPDQDLQANVRQLSITFPMFRWTTVLEEDAEVQADGSLLYTLQLPPAKSNG